MTVVRWLAILPAAVAVFAGVAFTMGLAGSLQSGLWPDHYAWLHVSVLTPAAAGFAFVWAGKTCAPEHKALVAALLAGAAWFFIAYGLAAPGPRPPWLAAIAQAAGALGAVGLTLRERRNRGDGAASAEPSAKGSLAPQSRPSDPLLAVTPSPQENRALSIEEVREIIRQVQIPNDKFIGPLIKSRFCVVQQVDSRTITLGFTRTFKAHKDRLDQDANRRLVEQAIREVCGLDYSIKVVLVNDGG